MIQHVSCKSAQAQCQTGGWPCRSTSHTSKEPSSRPSTVSDWPVCGTAVHGTNMSVASTTSAQPVNVPHLKRAILAPEHDVRLAGLRQQCMIQACQLQARGWPCRSTSHTSREPSLRPSTMSDWPVCTTAAHDTDVSVASASKHNVSTAGQRPTPPGSHPRAQAQCQTGRSAARQCIK
jgi:hypothetical protein